MINKSLLSKSLLNFLQTLENNKRTEAKEGEQEHSDGRPIALALFRL